MGTFVSSWPDTIKTLKFDTCRSNFMRTDGDFSAQHFCALLAGRLDGIEEVRLRMRTICPSIYSNGRAAEGTRPRRLVIRLPLPIFPEATYETHNGSKGFDTNLCGAENKSAFKEILEAGAKFAQSGPMLSRLRIARRNPGLCRARVIVADRIFRRFVYEPFFKYHDFGKQWMDLEEDDARLHLFIGALA